MPPTFKLSYQITELIESHAVGNFSLYKASIMIGDFLTVFRENLHAVLLFA